MQEVERSAASVEEAVEAALEELGVSEQEARVEIVQEPQKGLLGFGSQEAIVRVRVLDEDLGVDLEEQAEVAEGFLLGRHGQTLDALQEVVRCAVQRQLQARCRVMVDVEDYRKRRRSQLVQRARSVAARVRRTGRPERMEAMSPYERKIVHDAASEVGGVETASEGEDPDRRVVIRRRR